MQPAGGKGYLNELQEPGLTAKKHYTNDKFWDPPKPFAGMYVFFPMPLSIVLVSSARSCWGHTYISPGMLSCVFQLCTIKHWLVAWSFSSWSRISMSFHIQNRNLAHLPDRKQNLCSTAPSASHSQGTSSLFELCLQSFP